jgi:chromosome segregation ATPase
VGVFAANALKELQEHFQEQQRLYEEHISQWQTKCNRKEDELKQMTEEIDALKLSSQEQVTDYERRIFELTTEIEDLSSKSRSAHQLLERKEDLVKLLNEKATSLETQNSKLTDRQIDQEARLSSVESANVSLQNALKQVIGLIHPHSVLPRAANDASTTQLLSRDRVSPVVSCKSPTQIPVRSSSVTATKVKITSKSRERETLSRSQESLHSSSSGSQTPDQRESREVSTDEPLSSSSSTSDLEASNREGMQCTSKDSSPSNMLITGCASDSGVESLVIEAVEAVKLSMDCHATELETLQIQVSRLKAECQKTVQQAESTEEERCELAKSVLALKADLETSNQNLTDMRLARDKYREELERIQIDCDEQKQQLSNSEACNLDMQAQLEKLQGEIKQLSEVNQNLLQAQQELQSTNRSLSEDLDSVKEQLTDRQLKVIEGEEAVRKLENEVNQLKRQVGVLKQSSEELNGKILQLDSEKTELQLRLRNTEQTRDELEKRLIRSRDALKASKEENMQLMTQAATLEGKLTHLESQLQDVTIQKDSADAHVTCLSQSSQKLTNEVETLQLQVQQYETNIQLLNDQLCTVNGERADLSTQLINNQQHLKQMEQSLSTARTQLSTVQQTVKQLAEDKARLDLENVGLERRLSSMEEENSSLDSALTAARKSVKDSATRVTEMKIQLEDEAGKLAVECETKKELQLRVNQLQSELSETIAVHENEAARLIEEKQRLETKLEELNQERDRLVSASQEERDALIAQLKHEDERKQLEVERMREETALNASRERRIEVSKLENEKAALADKLREVQRDKDTLESKMASMRSAIEFGAVERERNSLQERVQDLELDLQQNQGSAKATEEALIKKTSELEKVTSELRVASLSVDSSRCALDENKKLTRQLETSCQEHLAQLRDLKGRLKAVEQEKTEAMREAEMVRRRFKDLEERAGSLQKERSELLSSISDLKRFRGGDQAELSSLKLKLSQEESERMTLGMQLENTKHKLGAVEECRMSAAKENIQLKMSQKDWEEQYAQLQRQSQSLSLKLAQMKETVSGKESELKQLTQRLETEMKLKCEVQTQLIDCQRKLQLEASACEEQRCRVTALEAQVGILTGPSVRSLKSEKLRQTLEESRYQLKAAEETIATLETRVHVEQAETASLSSQLLVIKEDRNRLRSDLQTLIYAFESSVGVRGELLEIPTTDSLFESGFSSATSTSPVAGQVFPNSPNDSQIRKQGSTSAAASPLYSISPSKVRKVQEAMLSLRKSVKDKEQELSGMKLQTIEKNRKIWELEASLSKTNAQADGLLAVLGHFASPGQKPSDKFSVLERALRTQNETFLKGDDERKVLKADIDRLRLNVKSLERDLESALEQNLQLRTTHNHLLEERTVSDKQAGKLALEREEEMEKLRQRLSTAKHDLLESQQREQRSASELNQINGELKQVQVELSQQKQEANVASQEIPVLLEQKRRLETEVMTSKKSVSRLKGEVATLKQQLLSTQEGELRLKSHKSTLQQKSCELESAVLIQQATVAELEAKLGAAERKLEVNQQAVSELEVDLLNCTGERDALRKRVEILKETQKESENQVSSLQLHLSDMQRVLNHTETTHIRTSGELRDSEEKRRQLKGELKSAIMELEKVTKEYEQARGELSKRISENSRMKSEYEEERARYVKLVHESSDHSHLSRSLARDLESERDMLSRKLMVQEAENRELQAKLIGVQNKSRSDIEEHTQKLFEMEVAHDAELQRRYEVQHRSEGETVDRLRQRMRELQAKVTTLQTELASRARKKQRYIAKTAEKDREIRRLQALLGDSLRTVAGSPDPQVLQKETSRLNRSATELGSGASISRLQTLSPLYSSTPRGPERK